MLISVKVEVLVRVGGLPVVSDLSSAIIVHVDACVKKVEFTFLFLIVGEFYVRIQAVKTTFIRHKLP
jgi:hypothetical protein